MIIGITGFIGSGKDTIADYLVSEFGYTQLSFASALKDVCSSMFHWDRDMLEGKTKDDRIIRNEVDQWWAKKLEIPNFSPRLALQLIGTDVLRVHFNDNIWIYSLEKKILDNSNKNVVLSDVRFPNEAKLIKSLGGIMMNVVRGDTPEWYDCAFNANNGDIESLNIMKTVYKDVHISEWANIGVVSSDIIIDNNRALEHLYDEINRYMNSIA